MIQKISGTVIHGNALGRTLGFPTANIVCEESISDSVFMIRIIIDSHIYSGIGTNMVQKGVFEAHIFDFDGDIYGKDIEVVLLKKIRDNIRFQSFSEVKEQIQQDQDTAQNTKLNVLTFGSFDHLHKGHAYYLYEAKKYGNILITIIATDKNIHRIKGRPPQYSQKQRLTDLEKLGIADELYIGSEENPLSWIEKFRPHVICLGYDQRGKFVESLPQKIIELGLDTEIIRIPAYYPNSYKSSILKQKKEKLHSNT